MTAPFGPTTVAVDALADIPRFTSNDNDKIREYVSFGSSLPVVVQAVEVFVGYKTAGVAGLEPADLRSIFEQVRDNAEEWDTARDVISQQTGTLASIAGKVVRSGESLIEAVKALPFYTRISATVGRDLAELPPIEVPDEGFGPADTQKKSALAGQLETLRKVNLGQVGDTEETMRMIASFRRGIEVLEPLVASKRLAVKNSNLEKIGHEITVEPMIAALQQEYDRAVRETGRNAAVAEAKREQLDTAIQMLKSQMDVFRGRQRVTYTMGRLFVHFTELNMVMVDAEMAVGHLWLASKEAAAALENSSAGFGSIDSSRKLVTFLTDFQIMIGNWKIVQNRATELNRIL
ncbi:MAG: hypothetical protein H7Y20_02470 [Bryobacteraceae bacterium]|nr:hypothetical protein [Bryobacteraceae bacterium]